MNRKQPRVPSQPIEILIATGNPSKAREIEAVLCAPSPLKAEDDQGGSPKGWGEGDEREKAPTTDQPTILWKTLKDLPPIPEPDETGLTFAENAALKARYYSNATGLWTLADDSGLEVDALHGDPGVRSARFADDIPENAPRDIRDPANNRKLIGLLKNVPPHRRSARFRCALALADGQKILATADGTIEGVIIDTPRGQNGFGYDPHFLVTELGQTTAELAPIHKNKISHRGIALQLLRERLLNLLPPN